MISFIITSFILTTISVFQNVFSNSTGSAVTIGQFSSGFEQILDLSLMLLVNLLIHSWFYFENSRTAPIYRGIKIGAVLGLVTFWVSVFVFDSYNVGGDSILVFLGGLGGTVAEYTTGGALTALISVTEIHKWGFLRAF